MPPATSLAPCCCYRDIVLPRHRWHPAAATATSLALCCRSRARAAPLTPPIPPTSAIQPKIRANAPVFIFGVASPLRARVIYPDHGTRPVFMIPVPGVRFFGLRDRDHETRPAERAGGLQEAAAPHAALAPPVAACLGYPWSVLRHIPAAALCHIPTAGPRTSPPPALAHPHRRPSPQPCRRPTPQPCRWPSPHPTAGPRHIPPPALATSHRRPSPHPTAGPRHIPVARRAIGAPFTKHL
jgi:hypothetical protein